MLNVFTATLEIKYSSKTLETKFLNSKVKKGEKNQEGEEKKKRKITCRGGGSVPGDEKH